MKIQVPKGTKLFKDLGAKTASTGKGSAYMHLGKIPPSWIKGAYVQGSGGRFKQIRINVAQTTEPEYTTIYAVMWLGRFDKPKEDKSPDDSEQ